MDSRSLNSDHIALWNCIPRQRMETFIRAAGSDSLALDLFVWDRDVSAALLADIAVVEVSMREAFHRAATDFWGAQWYTRIELDERSEQQLAEAWKRLPKGTRQNPREEDVPGRLVGNCMFGFWTNLLDRGGYIGKGPKRRRVRYNDYWPQFKNAFPEGLAEAQRQREAPSGYQSAEPFFDRPWVFKVCRNVNSTRNRISHHEPVVLGVPISGTGSANRPPQRMRIEQAHEEVLKLARMLDESLGLWVKENSRVPELLIDRSASI